MEAFVVPRLDVSIVAPGEVLECDPMSETEINAWLVGERALMARPEPEPSPGEPDLMAPYRSFYQQQAKAANDMVRSLSNMGMVEQEDQRTEQQFDAELEGHLAACEEVLNRRVNYLLRRHPGNWLRLSLVNNTETVFREVEVRVTVHDARYLEPVESWPDLPKLRPWRSRRLRVGWYDAMNVNFGLRSMVLGPRLLAPNWRQTQIEVTGRDVRVVFPDADLRPMQRVNLPIIQLVPLGRPNEACCIEWAVTAMNADGLVRGTVCINTATSTVSLAELRNDDAPSNA